MMRRLWNWTPALAAMATIGWLSHQPQWPKPVTGYPDWLLHAGAYAVLAALAYWGATDGYRAPGGRARWTALVVASGYGAVDEWHQSFVPGRHAGLEDWVADTVGALLFVGTLVAAETFAGSRNLVGESNRSTAVSARSDRDPDGPR